MIFIASPPLVLIIIWFYQFYRKGKLNAAHYIFPDNTNNPATGGSNINNETGNRTCFYIAISIIVLLVLQFYLFWRTGDRLAAYTIVPLLVIISLFAWETVS